jgi:hypothetical protein
VPELPRRPLLAVSVNQIAYQIAGLALLLSLQGLDVSSDSPVAANSGIISRVESTKFVGYEDGGSMKGTRAAALLVCLGLLGASGCGSKAPARERHEGAQASQLAPPTPDTTPIEALRTPAGLLLKVGETPVAVTPVPSPSVTAEPTKAVS